MNATLPGPYRLVADLKHYPADPVSDREGEESDPPADTPPDPAAIMMTMPSLSSRPGVVHLDETGEQCTRHPAPDFTNLNALAIVGSRAPTFSHDVASKLQRLIMAISELDDVAPEDSSLRIPIESAKSALAELQTLFLENRALMRSPVREPHPIDALVKAARLRVGVLVHAELPPVSLGIHVAAVTHALAQLLDLVATSGDRGRIAAISAHVTDAAVTLTLPSANMNLTAGDEVLALATFVFARTGGELQCTPEAFLVRLPRG